MVQWTIWNNLSKWVIHFIFLQNSTSMKTIGRKVFLNDHTSEGNICKNNCKSSDWRTTKSCECKHLKLLTVYRWECTESLLDTAGGECWSNKIIFVVCICHENVNNLNIVVSYRLDIGCWFKRTFFLILSYKYYH